MFIHEPSLCLVSCLSLHSIVITGTTQIPEFYRNILNPNTAAFLRKCQTVCAIEHVGDGSTRGLKYFRHSCR